MLSIRNLSISFTMYGAGLHQRQMTPVIGLDLELRAGELLGVVGASGSGKSLLAHAVLGILPANARVAGEIRFRDELLTPARQEQLRGREMALIPQSVGFLDPLMTVGQQARRAAYLGGAKSAATSVQRQVFRRYGLEESVGDLFPFQVSGGMARRVLVAMAAAGQASLIIADEPTPGLHPEMVVETLGHLRELADEGRAVLLITHDISAALTVSDRIAVFYAGTTVEVAASADFHGNGQALRHPYTRALWRALPQHEFIPVPGAQPQPGELPPGCLFEPRCPLATQECRTVRPELRAARGGWVRCIHVED